MCDYQSETIMLIYSTITSINDTGSKNNDAIYMVMTCSKCNRCYSHINISQTARITRYCLGSIQKSLAKEIRIFTCIIGPVTIFAAR